MQDTRCRVANLLACSALPLVLARTRPFGFAARMGNSSSARLCRLHKQELVNLLTRQLRIMFIVIAFIFIGIVAGRLMRRWPMAWLQHALTALVWVLLFLLGVEVGGNDQVIASLPTLGVEAAIIAGFATLGSCVLAMLLWQYVKRNGGAKA